MQQLCKRKTFCVQCWW